MKQGQKTKLHILVCDNAEWLENCVAQEVWEAAEAAGGYFTDDELRNLVNSEIHNALLDLEQREGWELTLDDKSGWHDWNGKGHTAHGGIRTYDDIDASQDARLFETVSAAIEAAKDWVS